MGLRNGAKVRLVDVAAKAGVSATTVSAVLRGSMGGSIRVAQKTAEKIRGLARSMDYHPNVIAQQLKGRPSDVIGVLIGAESPAVNFQRLAAIEREAARCGYRLMIGEFHEDAVRAARYVEDFAARGIAGLICFHNPMPQLAPQTLALMKRLGAVVFQTQSPIRGGSCIDVARDEGVRDAVEHLVSRGRKKIGLVLNSMTDRLMRDRLRGYQSGLKQAGIVENSELIWAGNGWHRPTEAHAAAAVHALVTRQQADAIIASNDFWAIQLIKTLRSIGLRVPGDVAIVGFDNIEAAELFDPALTTVDQNDETFAQAAVKMILEGVENGKTRVAAQRVVVRPRLVVRQST